MSRFLFPMASVTKPTGGRNVILSMIDLLNSAGFSARPLYASANYTYPFYPCNARPLFDRRLATPMGGRSLRAKLRLPLRMPGSEPVNEPLVLRPDDVLVIPEFRFPEVAAAYPNHRKICLVQVIMSFVAALGRFAPARLEAGEIEYIATSRACVDAVRTFAGREPREVVLQVGGPEVRFSPTKALKIAYMPRKLPRQVEAVVRTLKAAPEAEGVEFVSLSGLAHDEVMSALRDSLIFLSFSSEEGFGLPPAEAMAAGCIVVGYTGVGGNEFFNDDVGFPVPADDITEFVRVVRNVLSRYAEDRNPLDAMRKRASETVLSRYSEARFEESVLRAFAELDTGRVLA